MRHEVSAMEARQKLGDLLDQVYHKRDHFVIKRANKPMAVVIPMREYELLMKQRDRDLSVLDRIWSKVPDVSEAEAERDIAQAIKEVRAAKRAKS